MKITKRQLRNIVKEELSKIEEARSLSPRDAAIHYARQRNGSGLITFGNGMRMLKTVMSNLEDADDLENVELVKIAMKDLEKAMATMKEV
jgi:hypothetical protein